HFLILSLECNAQFVFVAQKTPKRSTVSHSLSLTSTQHRLVNGF
ncbi:unnamed protein product, partial [Amoebophrya sp. A25]